MKRTFKRSKSEGFWKVGVIPSAVVLDGVLGEARMEFHRLDLGKMFAKPDEVASAQVSLDTAEDAMRAISFFVRKGIGHSDGEKLLRLYGFLQAIFLQQDALEKLNRLFVGTPLKHSNESGWYHLRSLRNLTIGHPVEHTREKRGGKRVKRTFITRVSLQTAGFDYQVWVQDTEQFFFESADLDILLMNYLNEAAGVVKAVVEVLVSGPDYEPGLITR